MFQRKEDKLSVVGTSETRTKLKIWKTRRDVWNQAVYVTRLQRLRQPLRNLDHEKEDFKPSSLESRSKGCINGGLAKLVKQILSYLTPFV